MALCCDTSGGFPSAGKLKELSRDHSTIWGEINAIQQALLDLTTGCITDPDTGECVRQVGSGYCVTIGGETPMTWISSLATVIVTDGGIDYIPVKATATFFRPTGSTGTTDATADVIVTESGLVVDFDFTAPNTGGDGYALVETTIVAPTGIGFIYTVVVDDTTGEITDIVVDTGGTGYTAGDPLTISHPVGTNAVATIGTVDTGGKILSITISNGGQDYQILYSTVVVSHPIGLGFAGTVQVISGTVVGVSISSTGLFYADLYPSAVFTDGTGEETVVTLVDDTVPGPIDEVIIINGGNNFTDTTVGTIVSAKDVNDDDVGSGALIDVTVNVNPYGTTPYDYYLAVIGQGECAELDAIEQVIFYFTNLGYTIIPIPDETTGTISWEVCWC